MNRTARLALASTALVSLTGILSTATAAAAHAQTPPTEHPVVMRHHGHHHLHQSPVLGMTQGYNLYNYSAETFDYVKTTGSLPAPPTAPLTPGHMVNFELPAPFFGNTSGSVDYNVIGPDGTQIGTLNVGMTTNLSAPGGDFGYTFSDMKGDPLTTMTIPDNTDGQTMHLEDTKGSANSTQTYAAGSAEQQTIVNSVCQTISSACTFGADSEKTGYSAPRLLAEAYNGGTEDTQVTANNGYSDSTTDTWGAAITAESEFGPIKASVQANYSHAISTSTDFSTSYQAPVQAAHTTYIWAQIPQYQDTGTFTVKLGNTTWTLPGFEVDSAIKGDPLMYSNTQAAGDVPLPIDPGSHS
jgi:hypothetical protein